MEAAKANRASGSLVTLLKFYESFRGARVYNAPLIDEDGALLGNHGDHLMVLGGEHVHQDLGMEYVDEPSSADLLILGGNGGMFGWSDKGIPQILRTLSHEYPDIPICMEPATIYFPNQSISRLLPASRNAAVTLFCREQYSYDSLSSDERRPDFCQVMLDHDTALELRNSDLVQSRIGTPGTHVLIVERTDMEHPQNQFEISRARKLLNALCPPAVKQALYPLVSRYRETRESEFRSQCTELLGRDYPEFDAQPVISSDVSNVNTGSFDDFVSSIATASVVFTQRLHVGLLASMLNKPTYVFDGPYYKIKGIYEYSLRDLPHVHFVSNPLGWTVPERGKSSN